MQATEINRITSYYGFKEYKEYLKKENEKSQITKILVGMGTCGIAAGAEEVHKAILDEIDKRNLKDIEITKTGCVGLCAKEPVIEIKQGDTSVLYGDVTPDRARELVNESIIEGNIIKEWGIGEDDSFFASQTRIVLENCGKIDPESLEEAVINNAYEGLAKAVSNMGQQEVIDELKDSKLRGRGGAGFPTGIKWQFAYDNDSDKKYVICNADEGDPGAFMDRSVLEGDPHKLLEGMAICAYAIGADEGYIYCRAEYPLAVRRLKKAIADAEKANLLGENVFGSDFSIHLHVKEGAGAFVCGEETALIASI